MKSEKNSKDQEVTEIINKVMEKALDSHFETTVTEKMLKNVEDKVYDALSKLAANPAWNDVEEKGFIDVGVRKGKEGMTVEMYPKNVWTAMLMMGLNPIVNPPVKITNERWEQGNIVFIKVDNEIKYIVKESSWRIVINFICKEA